MKLQRKRLMGRRAGQALRSVALLLISGLMLAGCGVGRTMVIRPPDEQLRVVFVQAKEGNSPVAVPPEVKADFMNKLNHYLHGEDGFQRGPELTINYRFIQYESGSQFTRWFWGGIGNAGEASLTVEAKYFNPTNKEVATINAEGRIGSGFFGGALSEAVDKAAEKIAEYTKTNFR